MSYVQIAFFFIQTVLERNREGKNVCEKLQGSNNIDVERITVGFTS